MPVSALNRTTAQLGLALGLLIALAANLTYALPRGPVVVGLGLVAPLVLPVALYLRTTFTAVGFWQRAVREAATLAVAGPAAAISFSHTYELILSVHEPLALALLAPLSSDGLAGMATLALHRMRQPVQVRSRPVPQSRPRRDAGPPTPVVVAPTPAGLHEVGKKPPNPGRAERVKKLMETEGISRATAYRKVDEDKGVAGASA